MHARNITRNREHAAPLADAYSVADTLDRATGARPLTPSVYIPDVPDRQGNAVRKEIVAGRTRLLCRELDTQPARPTIQSSSNFDVRYSVIGVGSHFRDRLGFAMRASNSTTAASSVTCASARLRRISARDRYVLASAHALQAEAGLPMSCGTLERWNAYSAARRIAGAAALTSASTCCSNLAKFLLNISTRALACAS